MRKASHVMTSDGVKLSYLEAGSGKPLVMIPGWSQTAAMYRPQLDGLGQTYRVIALDMRGHGDSDKPAYGYRIARLAVDTHDALVALNLRDVVLAGHSMGCSVIYSYWEHFGADRLSKLILIDQTPALTAWPGWTAEEKATMCADDAAELFAWAAALMSTAGVKTTEEFVARQFRAFPPAEQAWALEENLKFPRQHAARLVVDHCTQDWRDVVPLINLPTMVVGGWANRQSQEWIGAHIPKARVEIFEAAEGGSHFMFLENPVKFNQIVREFIG
jgi:non-heme chloroperoxidase